MGLNAPQTAIDLPLKTFLYCSKIRLKTHAAPQAGFAAFGNHLTFSGPTEGEGTRLLSLR